MVHTALRPREWSLDIDKYLNPWIPAPPWQYIPYPVARFMGYRAPHRKLKDMGNVLAIFWGSVGAFCGLALIGGVSMHIPSFQDRHAPVIVGSFGAAAVLEFYAIDSPLAQPRNAVVGHLLATTVGICVSKLFQLSSDFDSLRWLGAAVACACATAAMSITKTVHPPAGATAMLAVADSSIEALGWFLLPVMMLGIALMMTTALLVNNLQRRFPVYWWTAEDLSAARRKKKKIQSEEEGMEKHGNGSGKPSYEEDMSSTKSTDGGEQQQEQQQENKPAIRTFDLQLEHNSETGELILRQRDNIVLPMSTFLNPKDRLILETIYERLERGSEDEA